MGRKYPDRNFKVLKGGTEKKGLSRKVKKILVFGVVGILLFSVIAHGVNYFKDYMTARMLEIEVVEISSINDGVFGTGFYIREEKIVNGGQSIQQGDIPHLTRVRRGQSLSSSVDAPISGLVMYFADGYEGFEPYVDDRLIAVFNDADEHLAREVSTGSDQVKIVNNYHTDIMVKVDREAGDLIKDLSRVQVRLGDEEASQILWVNVKGVKDYADFYVIHLFSDEIQDTLVETRFSDVFFILETITGINLPKQSIVQEQDKTGVYTLQRNRVVFREIAVMKEEGNEVWVVGLQNNQQVILNPQIVKNGQWIKF